MEGTFDILGPIELLQLLSQARQTGVFTVPQGEIYLDKGNPVHARFRDKVGSEGLFEVLSLKESQFGYKRGERPKQTTLEGSLDNYLLQAIRFMDARVEVGPFDLIQVTDPSRLTRLTLSPEESALHQTFTAPSTLFDLSSRSGLSVELVASHISHLHQLGLVSITPRIPRTLRLRVAPTEQAHGHQALLDTQLMRIWRNQYGAFAMLNLKLGEQQWQINVQAADNVGGQLLLSSDALFYFNLGVNQEVVVWPAI